MVLDWDSVNPSQLTGLVRARVDDLRSDRVSDRKNNKYSLYQVVTEGRREEGGKEKRYMCFVVRCNNRPVITIEPTLLIYLIRREDKNARRI